MMPGMDGFHASMEIRKLEFAKRMHTPIIACTALDADKNKAEAITCGIDDYLGKPYSRDMLAEIIEGWLNLKVKAIPLSGPERALVAAAASKNIIDRPCRSGPTWTLSGLALALISALLAIVHEPRETHLQTYSKI